MLPFFSKYWACHQQRGQALEDMRQCLWAAWIAKFPIDFIALTGHCSTKADESDCHRRKLRVCDLYSFRGGG